MLMAAVTNSCVEDEPTVLPAPQNLQASDDSALTIALSWNAVSGAEAYKIFRRDYTTSADSMMEIAETKETVFTDLEVESNSYYEYSVAAYNGIMGIPSDTILGSTKFVTAEEAFDVLAEFTDGKAYESTSVYELSDVILTVIGEQAQASGDLVFLIDNTGSMSDDIYIIQTNLNDIIDALPEGVRVGVAEYGDNNVDPYDWYDSTPLTTGLETVKTYINNITTTSGGDTPESVYDGLYKAIEEMNWSSTVKKMIIVIGDAPPLEGSYTNYTLKNVVDKAKESGIVTNLYPILVY